MDFVSLKASPRTRSGKGPARQLRAQGKLPIVAYGDDMETQALAIERDALRSILISDRGRNTIIKLEVDGGKPVDVMVKEYVVHPLSRQLIHADFVGIRADKPVICEVPFGTVGKAKGEVNGGTVLCNVRSVRVRCLPGNIPQRLEHDVSELEIDDSVKVAELTLPESVSVQLPPDRTLVIVAPPRVIEEVADAEGEGAEGADGAEAADGDDDKKDDGDKKDDKKDDKKG